VRGHARHPPRRDYRGRPLLARGSGLPGGLRNAPAVLLNNFTFVENVTEDSLKQLIRELREQPGKAMAPGPLPRMPDPHAHIEKQSDPQATGTLGMPAVATHPEAGPRSATDDRPRILTADWDKPQSWTLSVYRSGGGYQALPKALRCSAADRGRGVKSNLRGRGGAGFPTGMKWNFVRKETSVPSTWSSTPTRVSPGLSRTARSCSAARTCSSRARSSALSDRLPRHLRVLPGRVRDSAMARLQQAIDEAQEAGYVGKNILGSGFDLEIHAVFGAGAYICGEETALLESLEGRKGYPRLKPPFRRTPAGLFKQPTAVNNVETLANMPVIVNIARRVQPHRAGPEERRTRLYAVSGHVKKPGVYEAPMGISFKALLDEYCGGMRDGATLKGIIPGGASSAVMTAAEADWASDFDTLKAKKTMAGSGAVVYLDQSVNMAHALANLMKFFAHESCGQCTPCREGTAWLSRLLDKIVAVKARSKTWTTSTRSRGRWR